MLIKIELLLRRRQIQGVSSEGRIENDKSSRAGEKGGRDVQPSNQERPCHGLCFAVPQRQ